MASSHSNPTTFVAVAVASLSLPPVHAQDAEPKGRVIAFKDAHQQYRKLMRQRSMSQRLKARDILAQSKDPAALDILSAAYAKPEAPKQRVRYLLADLAATYFAAEEHYAALTSWRSDFDEATDSWLWFKTMEPLFMGAHMDAMLRAGEGRGDAFLRAAALQAMCEMIDGGVDQRPPVAASVTRILSKLPKDPLEKSLILEACAAVLHGQRRVIRERSGPWKPVARILIEALGDRRLPIRSKQVLARYFAPTFQLPNLGTAPHPWLQWLDRKPLPKRTPPTSRPNFFGLPTAGQRICYVIDASDSMLDPVPAAARERVDSIVLNQGSGGAPVPWDTIHTRFDLIREFLARSLGSLNKKTRVHVILFGDEAIPLAATPKLVTASPANISKILAQLAEIAQQHKPHKPNPTLRGATNLHAGMLQAFQATHSRPVQRDTYVHRKLFANGCDAIYLVSDGEPDRDNLGASGEYVYGRPPHDYLAEDLRRLNLFRKAQIHCVGLGAATPGLLSRIAASGFGSHLNIVTTK